MNEETDADRRGPAWLATLFALLFSVWLVGTPLLMLVASLAGMSWGTAATDADLARRSMLHAWAAGIGLGIPLVCLIASAIARRRVTTIVFGIALTVSMVVAGYYAEVEHRANRPAPTPDPHPVCQERSGDGDECPGD